MLHACHDHRYTVCCVVLSRCTYTLPAVLSCLCAWKALLRRVSSRTRHALHTHPLIPVHTYVHHITHTCTHKMVIISYRVQFQFCLILYRGSGGKLFSLMLPVFPGGAEGLCGTVYVLASLSMLVPIYSFSFWPIFSAFLVLEASLGMYNSCGGMLRSKYYPDEMQSSIMSVFRIPLNLLVVSGTKLSSVASTDIPSLKFVFAVIVCMLVAAFLLHCGLIVQNAVKSPQLESDDSKLSEGKKIK